MPKTSRNSSDLGYDPRQNFAYYPQSNGKIEGWHKSLKGECIRPGTPLSLDDARRLVKGYVSITTTPVEQCHRLDPGRPNWLATHGAEISYAFNIPSPAWTEVDRALADAMSSYWVNFAKNGNPNGPGLPVWPAIQTAAPEQVMILGPKIEVGQMLDSRRVTLFDFVAIRRSVAPAR